MIIIYNCSWSQLIMFIKNEIATLNIFQVLIDYEYSNSIQGVLELEADP